MFLRVEYLRKMVSDLNEQVGRNKHSALRRMYELSEK